MKMFLERIAIVIPTMIVGGSQRVVAGLSAYLAEQGIEVYIVSLDSASSFYPIHPRVKIIFNQNSFSSHGKLFRAFRFFWRVRWVGKNLREISPDIVLSFLKGANSPAIFATRLSRFPVVISERNDPAKEDLSIHSLWLRRYVWKHADCVTANSRDILKHIQSSVPTARCRFVPNSVSFPEESKNFSTSKNWIVSVARLEHQKGLDTLIKAFSILHRAAPDWQLHLIGSGKMHDELVNLSKRLGVENAVFFHGTVEDPYIWLRQADVFALPSRREGMPNAVLEAMAVGLPVVVSDASGGALEIVEDKVSGRVVPVGNSEALASAMEGLVQNPSERIRLGRSGQKKVSSLSPEKVYGQWMKLLNEVVVKKKEVVS